MLFGRHVNRYYFRYVHFFLLGIIALIAVDMAQLHIPECYSRLIDHLADKTLTNSILSSLLVEMLIVAVIMFVGRFAWRMSIFGLAVRIETDLRRRMFLHMEKLSQIYFQNNKTGAQMALYTNDLQTINMVFGDGTIMTVDALFLGILAFIKMFLLNQLLAIISAIPLVILGFCGGIIGKAMSKRFAERQKAYEDLSDFTQENISGISVVKAFAKETLELRAFAKINKNNEEKNVKFVRFATILNILISLLISSIVVIIIGYGSYLVIQTRNGVNLDFTVGKLSLYISYFTALVWPMMALANIINISSQGYASLKRINQLLDYPVEIVDAPDVVHHADLKGKITFSHLTFSYPGTTTPVLKDVTFEINVGESVGIIGKTGSGKTTIVDLLMRVYNIEEKQIHIDDVDIMKLPVQDVRSLIAYVPQDNFLFADTVVHNIGFSKAEPLTEEAARYYADLADVADNIAAFPLKYQTLLGERGVTVSGGQKQRISIARALAKDAKVLILDDAVSAVDTKTEAIILANLKKYHHEKTVIMIAHRISTVESMDKIILLDDGQVVACGNHAWLINHCKMYRDIVELQHLEDSVEGGAAIC